MDAPKPLVFVCYAHADRAWKERLLPFLEHHQLREVLQVWHDGDIGTGERWYEAITDRLSQARAAVLLVTAPFLASKFCRFEEVPVLLQRQRRGKLAIFPVLLDYCGWEHEPWLRSAQMKTWNGEPVLEAGPRCSKVFTELANEVVEAIKPGYEPPARAATPLPTADFDLDRLPVVADPLFGRRKELELLDDAWADPSVHVVSFVAGGGVGKSALVRVWCDLLAEAGFAGADHAYAWSFYSQGTGRATSADLFVHTALDRLGDPDPTQGSAWDRGERLARLVRERRTLLVLDGVEPLQSDAAGVDEGRVRDPALRALLEELARGGHPGLCVVTTRQRLTDLDEAELAAAVRQVGLDRVSRLAGRALLRVAGVKGEDEQLEAVVADLDGHALAVNLLASYVAETRAGRIEAARDALGSGVAGVLEAWATRLGPGPALDVLHGLGLFDRPADAAELAAATPGLSDLACLGPLFAEQWSRPI